VLNLAVAGLSAGGTYALIGVCIVLLYRVGAVVNFSQTFGPTLAVLAMTDFLDIWGLGQWTSVALAIALGAFIAAVQGLVMATLFRDADVMVRSTVSMAMGISLFALAVRIFHDEQRFFPNLFKSLGRKVGDVTVTGTVIMSFGAAIVAALALWLILSFTRLGIILRAISSRPVTAELMGVRTTGLIVLVWAIAGALTTAGLVLVAPTRPSITSLVILIIPGLAAAVFGAMRSLALTVIGGTVLGMIESVAIDWGTIGNYRPTLSFVAITLVLLWSQRKETWSEAR
jgi:branched-chain amino acid transport system permease protein